MADVFLARLVGPSGFSKLAVVKRLRERRGLDDDPDLYDMFLNEARLAARLNHPNIVQTFETGQDERGVYMAMEYLEGQTLSALLKRCRKLGAPLDLEAQAYVLAEVLTALEYAHNLEDYDGSPLKIVHRDVSPQNVFVTYRGAVKLVDFGVAKATSSSLQTRTGVIKGKVAYMAPEQAHGADDLDGRADLFSAGVMLWESLAGRRFWHKSNDMEILTQLIRGATIESPSKHNPAAPQALIDVAMKAVSIDRDQRYATAHDFSAALETACASLPRRATARELGALVSQHFHDDRERVRAALEHHGRTEAASQSSVPVLVHVDEDGGGDDALVPTSSPSTSGAPSTVSRSR